MVAERDKEFAVSTAKIRQKRIEAIGLEVPQLPPPESVEEIGRQWMATGKDEPTKYVK